MSFISHNLDCSCGWPLGLWRGRNLKHFDLELNEKTVGEIVRFCHHFIVFLSSQFEDTRVLTSVCSSMCQKFIGLKQVTARFHEMRCDDLDMAL